MLNGLYGYLFGNEDINNNDNNTKENVATLRDSVELVVFTPTKEMLETNDDDDWVLLDGQISGRSTPVFVSEPDLIPIDDELSTLANESLRSDSPTPTAACAKNSGKQPLLRYELIMKHSEHAERLREVKQKIADIKELEQKLFENNVLRTGVEMDKKQSIVMNNSNNKALNMLNNAAKMKRSTAAGHFASDSKTKPRSKKTNRLLAGRNNDRKVNNLV